MDGTAKILEQMDGTQFERFCGPVLRKMVPELKNLIASGINADGWTIKSPNDGFCFVEHDHFAMVHITTNASNLQGKWLYDGNAETTPKGDLIKSIAQAREMHSRHPDYRFSIFLVYNKPVPESLHIKVNEAVSDDFISVMIIEQCELVFFLDHESEGLYLRKKLLGIDADRISRSLLMDIAATNIAAYAREIFFEETLLTKTSVQRKVEDSLTQSDKTINLLTGDSGFGKSTLCYGLMHTVLNRGRVVLRVRSSSIEVAGSLKEAIQIQLRADYVGVYIRDEDIDTLFRGTFIVIDDINKSGKASLLLEKIISWNEKKQDDSISVICPVWPQNLNRLENAQQRKEMFAVIPLDPLSFYDCKDIIEKRKGLSALDLTDQQEHALILDTGFDPLLINLSLEFLKEGDQYNENIPRVAIESYIADQLKQIDSTYQIPQFKRVLNLLGEQILRNRKPDPLFFEVEGWLGHDTEKLCLINLIANRRKLFFFDDEGKIYFRHDRVRDQLLAIATINLLTQLEKNRDIFEDPYYAEIIGTALANSNMTKEVVESLVLSNPLAVFFSLKYLQDNSSEHKRQIVMAAIKIWRSSVTIELVPKAVIGNIAYALLGFDVKEIEVITNGFPKSAELDLAKFRNGIWLSAVFFFSSIDYFYPEAPTYWWNSILAHVKAKYLKKIIEELAVALSTRFRPEGISHAYTLVGFLGENIFVDPLIASWEKFKAPRNYPAYLWAILNCSKSKDRDVILDALSYWTTLSVEEKSTKLLYASLATPTVKEQITHVRWKFSDEIFSLLIDAGNDADLQEILALLLERIDHPQALQIVLNEEMKKEVKEYWRDNIAERWDPKNTHRKLSTPTLAYLLQEFSERKNNERRRHLAWQYWAENITEEIGLPLVRAVIEQDDPLFEKGLIWRIKHHDVTALSLIEELISKKPWHIIILANVWNEKSKAFFLNWLDDQLESKNSENVFSALEFLQRLDNDDACRMLIYYWEKLKFSKNAIETALFLSSSETRDLADKEIKRLGFVESVPMPEYYIGNLRGAYFSTGDGLTEEKKNDLSFLAKQFGRFHMNYGLTYVGEGERLTRAKIESLLPYLTLFDEHSLYEFSSRCLKIGAPDLCYDKFYPLLHGHLRSRIRFMPVDLRKDIANNYRELKRDKKFHLGLWLDDPEKSGITADMVSDALLSFSKEYHDSDAFFIITLILERVGTRRDINIINNFFLDFEKQPEDVKLWKENAIFAIKRRSLI